MQITINGKKFEANAEQTVLDVARANGIYIPTLCYHARTGQAAKCRACVAAIEGMRGLQTTCTVKVSDGMIVTTDSPRVKAAQRLVVDLMLSSGKHDCLSCAKCSECELQEAAYYLGIERPTFGLADDFEHDDSSEFIAVDYGKCIKCGRCTVGDNSTVVNEAMGFSHRGDHTKVVFDNGLPMGKSSCVQCGECVQLCPTGALTDKRAKGQGRPWQLEKVETVCPYCGVGCKLALHIDRAKNSIVRVTGVEDGPANHGMLCVKGRYGFDFVASPNRLTMPLIKENGAFRPASWPEAVTHIATRLSELREKHGGDAIGGLCSAKCTNEENYLFQKFIRTRIVTNNVDHCARL
jgi:formate dehydrogenase major subunit